MSIDVEVLTQDSDLRALRDDWNVLVREAPDTLIGQDATCTHEWFEALRTAFPEALQGCVITARRYGRLIGLLPVHAGTPSRLGPTVTLTTVLYCGRVAPLMSEPDPAIWAALLKGVDKAFPGWISMRMNFESRCPATTVALEESRRRGHAVQQAQHCESPFFPLFATAEEFKDGVSKSVLQMLRTARNKFAKLGPPIEFREYLRPDQATELLDLVLQVERHSWKHEAGTAITAQPRQEAFYRTLFPHALEAGLLYAAALWQDGKPIAHIFGTVRDQVFCCLKHSHAADFDKLSPSYLLNEWVFGRLRDSGVLTFDFMGRSDPHKLRWSNRNGSYLCHEYRLFNRSPKARLTAFAIRSRAKLRPNPPEPARDAG
ncbi:GNAT family N-acetyltransferase [Paucibacter sp. JuS9]|uniref:GNAT family N-acetyltransferase n=1 Tax=Paucibacter sp. JuS9 TaxID=3228748 RepID=UPI0037583B5D